MTAPGDQRQHLSEPSGQRVAGGAVSVLSAEAMIQYSSGLPEPYKKYVTIAAPIIAAFGTAVVPKVFDGMSAVISLVLGYISERLAVRRARRIIDDAKALLTDPSGLLGDASLSEEEHRRINTIIKEQRRAIIDAHLSLPKRKPEAAE